MCNLSTKLTPIQWQSFWCIYTKLFGVNALPVHLLSFFSEIIINNKILTKNYHLTLYNNSKYNLKNLSNLNQSSSVLIKKKQCMCF